MGRMKIDYLNLQRITRQHASEIHESVEKVVNSGWYLQGEATNDFETSYAKYIGTQHCIGCGNGLDALTLIFRAYKVLGKLHEGDEVIVPANTYIASILSLTENRLKPILAEPDAFLQLDATRIETAITPKTRAVLLVHLYGTCAMNDLINDICHRHSLLLIEDNAQGHGLIWHGKRTGSIGDAAAHSFYPGKNLGALGDAGAVTTDDEELAQTIRSIANVLASTDLPGLSGSQIDELLLDIGAPPRVAGSKREGLFGALTEGMSAAQAGQLTREFITTAMSPARHTTDRQRWNDLRRLLNKVLATEGWHIDDAGELTQLAEAARTFDDIERLTSSLVEELQRRGTHERLMEYCSQELIAESLFHAISEAAKSIPDRIRILTSLTDDGQELFDAALGTNNSAPKLVINNFSTESEKSEHKGFKNLLIGIHGHYRNPRAHKTRLGSEEGKHDFLDAFSLFSYVHRRLDSAQQYQSFM